MKFKDLIDSEAISKYAKIIICKVDQTGAPIPIYKGKLEDWPIGNYMDYKDSYIAALGAHQDHLNIVLDEYMN